MIRITNDQYIMKNNVLKVYVVAMEEHTFIVQGPAFSTTTLSISTISITGFSIMTLNITTISIIAFSKTTIKILEFSILTLSITK
jgi:hypothetical protein